MFIVTNPQCKICILLNTRLNMLPPTVNHMYINGRGRRFKTSECRAFQQNTTQIFIEHKNPFIQYPYVNGVKLNLIFIASNNRRWDLDNRLKAIQDCLQLSNIIKDDKQINELYIRRMRGFNDATLILLAGE